MDIAETIHILENSRLSSEHFTSDGLTAAYVEVLAALYARKDHTTQPMFGEWKDAAKEPPTSNGRYLVQLYTLDNGPYMAVARYTTTYIPPASGVNERGKAFFNRAIPANKFYCEHVQELIDSVAFWMPLPQPKTYEAERRNCIICKGDNTIVGIRSEFNGHFCGTCEKCGIRIMD